MYTSCVGMRETSPGKKGPTVPRLHRPLDHSPEEWRDLASKSAKSAADSFDRCGDDGFMSQAANNLHSDIYRTCAKLAEVGGKDTFPGLFRRSDGARVRAKLISGQYGPCWAFCDEKGNFTGRFLGDSRTKRAKLYKEGFEVRDELAPAAVTIQANGTGMVGAFLASSTTVRDDEGYPENSIVIKNGDK